MTVTSRYSDSRLTVCLAGELDHHCAREAMHEISEAADSFLPREIVLDLRKLSFMDSSGIAVIIKTHRSISLRGGKLYVECPQAQPMKVLRAAGIGSIVEIISKREVTT